MPLQYKEFDALICLLNRIICAIMIPIYDLIESLSEAECKTLEEMSQHHRYSNFQLRARGLLALNAGHSPAVVAGVLRKTPQTVYNWAKWWRKDGLAGILNGNKGGRPLKLTAEMLDTAEKIVREKPLTLAMIKRHVQEQHPTAPDFSLFRLSAGLKKRNCSFKRTRLSLKKTG